MNATLFFACIVCCFTCACTSNSDAGEGDTPRSKDPSAASQPTTSPASDASSRTVLNFDQEKAGELPPGWKAEGTNQKGPVATWKVIGDDTAPSKPNALALASTNHDSGSTFNICWTERVPFQDGRIEVAVKAISGVEDQGGGPIWRVQDKDNYYICRANPLESNFRVYYVQDGSRKQLASANTQIPTGRWLTLAVEHRGDHIVCFLNGEKLLEATDNHIPKAGGVGLWTKADSVTSFDDLVVVDR